MCQHSYVAQEKGTGETPCILRTSLTPRLERRIFVLKFIDKRRGMLRTRGARVIP